MISAPGGRGAAPGGRGAARGSRKARSCLEAVGALELDDLHRRWAGGRAGSGWAVGGRGSAGGRAGGAGGPSGNSLTTVVTPYTEKGQHI